MAEPCLPEIDKKKLVRDGTGQAERFSAALYPQSVPVHDRAPEHSMLFAREYAAFLKYYPASNEYEGENWQVFFDKDVSVALAAAAVQDVDRYRSVILQCFRTLEDHDNADSPEVVRHNFGFIFGAIGTLVTQLDALRDRLPADIALKATIVNLITTRLAKPLKHLVSWFNEDQARTPVDLRLIESELVMPKPHDDYEVSILGVAPIAFQEMLKQDKALSKDWLGEDTWHQFRNTDSAPSVYGDKATVFELANACAGHNLFSGACDQFLKAYARIVSDAKAELEVTLKSYDKHDPHYALFLAFLRMFEYARADINALAGKHLDFYYRQVLQLAERPAEPSKAHVVVELAKNTQAYELVEGSEFKARKDALKHPVVFTSDETLVANQAVVSSVRNLYRDTDAGAIYVNAAAQVEDDSWHPFENKSGIGSFGFSIASHYLYLAEGTRTVTLTVILAAGVDGYGDVNSLLDDAFLCRFTTAKGWLEVSPSTVSFTSATTLVITIVLDGDQPGIAACDSKVHASSYDVALPILEVRVEAGKLSTFSALESLMVQSIMLRVDVTGFRSLALSTDLGPADASKPFQPFGPAPVVGSALVIGCQEAFSKKGLDKCELSLAWRNWSPHSTEARIQCLSGGEWQGSAQVSLMDASPQTVLLTDALVAFNTEDDPSVTYAAPFSLKATSGYVRLNLQGTLGHATYAVEVAEYVINAVQGEAAASRSTFPQAPYTPELESISLTYRAAQSIDCGATERSAFDGRTARFFHVTSFGLAEQHGYLQARLKQKSISLMPLLCHRNALDPAVPEGTRVPHEGEMYIGLGGVVAPQNVSLLFQVVDGSADPLAEKPSPHLHYSYLRNGDWVAFTTDHVDDRTSELLASGIITFSVPADATTSDTLLPGGLTWIRIAVGESTQAVCRLLAVKAQAVQVTFADRKNDTGFLATPLAARTITKLVTPVAAIKSVSQPYESFGNRMKETAPAFRTRVSERLRHKDRAIALWDIERLVLEAFPGIHRVKSLNHTRYEPTVSGDGIYQELAAGHITVVTIPAVSTGYAADPLTPYTSLGVVEEIEAYLAERLSCFATLHVRNPAYERLLVDCKVRLREGFDETYCLTQLRTSITQFLAPWAFDATLRPSFGGKVYRSSLLNFLEEQDCVDYVTDFRLYRKLADESESEAQAVVVGTQAASVLASVPAAEHRFAAIDETHASGALEECGCTP